MTPEQIQKMGGIYFDKIQNGMTAYDWESQYFSPRMADQFLRKLWKENGEDSSFVDCYFPFLEQESQERVLSVLNEKQQAYLKEISREQQELLLPLSDELMEIALLLIDREMLFFSFYFTKTPCTIWGNYKQEYLIFRKKH